MQHTEELLITIDNSMHRDRSNLVNLLNYVTRGIQIRESSIKEKLAQIAALEMTKGKVEDALLGQILKTIEIININDIAIEK